MKYIITENELDEIELFILRRVSWDKVLEGLDDGIRWAERRYDRYRERWNTMDFSKYDSMVIGVLMDHINSDLIDPEENSIDYDFYQQITSYLSKLFSDVIKNSYNNIAD
jgi:hypothetical protein